MNKNTRLILYQLGVFILTFFTYASLHSARSSWSFSKRLITREPSTDIVDSDLGTVDFVFLFSYSISLYLFGWIGDKIDLRIFIAIGLSGAAMSFGAISIIGFQHKESMAGLVLLMGAGGMFQAFGWPGCIAVLGNWIEPNRRGILLGLWAGTRNFGNIVGYEIGHIIVDEYSWSWPSILAAAALFNLIMVVIDIFLLKPYPEKCGFEIPNENTKTEASKTDKSVVKIEPVQLEAQKPINFFRAWLIPGVPLYALTYASVKGTCYGILFWLTTYLRDKDFSEYDFKAIAQTSDIGMFFGGFLLGYISDKISKKALFLPLCLIISTMMYAILIFLTKDQIAAYYICILIAGFFLGAPYNTIGSVVAASLGKHPSIKGNQKSLSTVTGIIEGTGSLVASLTQLFIPLIGVDYIYVIFIFLCLIGTAITTPLAWDDYKSLKATKLLEGVKPKSESEITSVEDRKEAL